MAFSPAEQIYDPHFIPLVESSVFEDHPEAAFWVGVVASGSSVVLPEENLGAIYRLQYVMRMAENMIWTTVALYSLLS
jgi:hypothetical protein